MCKFGIWRIAINNPSGTTDWFKDTWYYAANGIPSPQRYHNHLYCWGGWDGTDLENYQTPATRVGNYNDNLVITLEAGYVYYFTRLINLPFSESQSRGYFPKWGGIYEYPITIKVNDPVYLDAESYIPISRPQAILGVYDSAYVPLTPTLPTLPSIGGISVPGPYLIPGLLKPRRSMEVVMGIDVQTSTGYEVVNNGITYTLENGFVFDEINSTISVFDGNYNNLINKPILGTIPDINTDHIVQNLTTTNKFIVNNTYNNNLSVDRNLTIMADYNAISTYSATSSGIIENDRYLTFNYTRDTLANSGQTQYTFTTTQTIVCDILIVAGGGGGSLGGGGAGTCIVAINQTLPVGTYNVNVEKGGTGSSAATLGNDSSISLSGGTTIYLTKGGGPGGYNMQVVSGDC